jgi:hypothetical protein
MTEPLRVRSVLICDDVRQEKNGKEILIGVYRDVIVVKDIPYVMPGVFFWISTGPAKAVVGKRFGFKVTDPANNAIAKSIGMVSGPSEHPEEPYVIRIRIENLVLTQAGKYAIFFGEPGHEDQVSSFIVRPPDSKEARLLN